MHIYTRYTHTSYMYIYYTVQGRGKRVRGGGFFVLCLTCLSEEVQPLCTKMRKSAEHTSKVKLKKKRETGGEGGAAQRGEAVFCVCIRCWALVSRCFSCPCCVGCCLPAMRSANARSALPCAVLYVRRRRWRRTEKTTGQRERDKTRRMFGQQSQHRDARARSARADPGTSNTAHVKLGD